jgi:hypothetical protein
VILVAIGVGGVVAIVLMCLIFVYLGRRSKRAHKQSRPNNKQFASESNLTADVDRTMHSIETFPSALNSAIATSIAASGYTMGAYWVMSF